ncbi:MAG: tRNA 5-methoxyuridine(34)/uridine 5-oxyacetic acid(34) synthase CmoB [Pseudomonadota bacterium]
MHELDPRLIRHHLETGRFAGCAEALSKARPASELRHGDWPKWATALAGLPDAIDHYALDKAAPTLVIDESADAAQTREHLMALRPWRKGPWQFGEVAIDTEWRSDLKWDRMIAADIDFADRRVLDIGGGNGYFALRCAAAGAHEVLNVDPTLLFYAQYLAFTQHVRIPGVGMAPIRFEQLPDMRPFDLILSMGVLYHRRDPIEHLRAIANRLCDSGALVLETLVLEGTEDTALVPEDRYARMRNVWSLPTISRLEDWLTKAGFTDVECHDVTRTTTEEQRPTEWMTFESLAHALDPNDANRTVEGHPAPVRAMLSARLR